MRINDVKQLHKAKPKQSQFQTPRLLIGRNVGQVGRMKRTDEHDGNPYEPVVHFPYPCGLTSWLHGHNLLHEGIGVLGARPSAFCLAGGIVPDDFRKTGDVAGQSATLV